MTSVDIKTVDEPTPPEKPAETPSSERPEWLPEKFKTPEDFAKAYGELESKLGGKKPAEEPAPEETPEGDPSKKLEIPEPPAGLSEGALTPFQEEYAEKGELTPESFEKLEKMGFGREVVEQYIAGAEATAEREAAALNEITGGEEQFTKMAEWGATNLKREEVLALNAAFEAGGDQATMAARSLRASYEAVNGKVPNLVSADGPSITDGGSYASYDEMMKDMANPDYKKDSAFRAKVAAKLQRSPNIL